MKKTKRMTTNKYPNICLNNFSLVFICKLFHYTSLGSGAYLISIFYLNLPILLIFIINLINN